MRRVQKYIETLDMIKVQTAKSSSMEGKVHNQRQGNSTIDKSKPIQKLRNEGNYNEKKLVSQKPLNHSESILVTTKWETFE